MVITGIVLTPIIVVITGIVLTPITVVGVTGKEGVFRKEMS